MVGVVIPILFVLYNQLQYQLKWNQHVGPNPNDTQGNQKFFMDLNATLNRIKKISGVMGYVIINDKAQVVHTTLDEEEATSLGAITIKVEFL